MISRKNKTVALEVAFKLLHGLNVSLERLNGEAVEKETEKSVSDTKLKLIRQIEQMPEAEVLFILANTIKGIKKVME